jgi:tetratricopeptide (TPR) repeat protein
MKNRITGIMMVALLMGGSAPVIGQEGTSPASEPNAAQPRSKQGFIGIDCWDLTPERARAGKLPEQKGILVTIVRPQGPAATAGLKVRDVIIQWDNQNLAGAASLRSILSQTPPEKKIVVKFMRDGRVGTTTITVGEVPPAVACGRRGYGKAVSGDFAGAIADCTEAIRLDPGDGSAYVMRGEVKYYSGDYAGCIADCTEAIRLDPENEPAYYWRGGGKLEKDKGDHGEFDGAIADFTEAIRLDPGDGSAYVMRGLAMIGLGRRKFEKRATANFNEGIRLLTEAINLDPNASFAYADRSLARERLGDKNGAAQDRATSAKLDEQAAFAGFQNRAKAWLALAQKPALPEEVQRCRIMAEDTFKNDKDFEKALKYYDKGLAIDPLWPDGQLNAAIIAGELHHYAEAASHMKRYLELVPNAPNASGAREKLYLWEGKAEEEPQK